VKSVLLYLAVAGTLFFLVRGIQMRSSFKDQSKLEIKRAELDAARARDEKLSPRQRFRAALIRAGYDGDMFPFVALMAFLYLAVTASLHVIGMSTLTSSLAALPAAGAVVISYNTYVSSLRRRRFNEQLVELLELIAGQIEAGSGAQKALETVVPTMQEPLRGEMSRVLDAQVASKDLIGAIRELSVRYPSRAFELFIAALEIDRADGHAIGPALHQSADLLKGEFRLAAEANAELSQSRMEFLLILAILGGIGAKMLFSGDPQRHAAYVSPIGLILVIVAGANVAFGVFRFLRMINNIRGVQ
jgi:tight adherence protein B